MTCCPLFLLSFFLLRHSGGVDVPTQGKKRSRPCVCVTGELTSMSPLTLSHSLSHTHTHDTDWDIESLCVQMRELVSTLSSDPAVRVVVFRSLVPGVFCAGKWNLPGLWICDRGPSKRHAYCHDVYTLQVQTWKRELRWTTLSLICSFTACDPSWLK